jgi:hypothetical protein
MEDGLETTHNPGGQDDDVFVRQIAELLSRYVSSSHPVARLDDVGARESEDGSSELY